MGRCLKHIVGRAWLAAVTVVAILVIGGCSANDEDNLSQRELIITYLEGSHNPQLISESDLSSSLESEPHFYSTIGEYTFRYISTFYDSGRSSQPKIDWNSKVTITFELYMTTNGSASSTTPLYTNNSEWENYYINQGLNTEYWDFTPKTFEMGNGTFMDGVEDGLVDCRLGDVVYLLITRNMAYNNNVIGLADEGSAMLFICTIDEVEN